MPNAENVLGAAGWKPFLLPYNTSKPLTTDIE